MKVSVLDTRVVKFIEELDKPSHAKVSYCFDLLEEFGNEVGPPHSKKVSKDLYELRITGKIAVRLLYVFRGDEAIIVHGFIKKTEKIPKRELEIALRKLQSLHKR